MATSNRAGLNRPTSSRPSAPSRAAAGRPSPARAPVASTPARPHKRTSNWKDFIGALLMATILVSFLLIPVAAGMLMKDTTTVGTILSEESQSKASMVCLNGKMVRGDGSPVDFVFEPAVFVCTDWKIGPGSTAKP